MISLFTGTKNEPPISQTDDSMLNQIFDPKMFLIFNAKKVFEINMPSRFCEKNARAFSIGLVRSLFVV